MERYPRKRTIQERLRFVLDKMYGNSMFHRIEKLSTEDMLFYNLIFLNPLIRQTLLNDFVEYKSDYKKHHKYKSVDYYKLFKEYNDYHQFNLYYDAVQNFMDESIINEPIVLVMYELLQREDLFKTDETNEIFIINKTCEFVINNMYQFFNDMLKTVKG